MSKTTILKPLAITRAQPEKGLQFYQFQGEDSEGNLFVLNYACKLCYTESVEKTFSRLILVNVAEPTTPEGEKTDGTSEVAATNEG
jgi:hypothetical protein